MKRQGGVIMLIALLAVTNLLWFMQTECFAKCKMIKIGGDQMSCSLSALIIVIYLVCMFVGIIQCIKKKPEDVSKIKIV